MQNISYELHWSWWFAAVVNCVKCFFLTQLYYNTLIPSRRSDTMSWSLKIGQHSFSCQKCCVLSMAQCTQSAQFSTQLSVLFALRFSCFGFCILCVSFVILFDYSRQRCFCCCCWCQFAWYKNNTNKSIVLLLLISHTSRVYCHESHFTWDVCFLSSFLLLMNDEDGTTFAFIIFGDIFLSRLPSNRL